METINVTLSFNLKLFPALRKEKKEGAIFFPDMICFCCAAALIDKNKVTHRNKRNIKSNLRIMYLSIRSGQLLSVFPIDDYADFLLKKLMIFLVVNMSFVSYHPL